MTGESALFGLVAFLALVVMLWRAFRLLDERLSEIHENLDSLHNAVSRLSASSSKPEAKSFRVEPSVAPTKPDYRPGTGAPPSLRGLNAELTVIDGLCAKLISLVPPDEAVPLLNEDSNVKVEKPEGRKLLLAWPPRTASPTSNRPA
jgi:hypothetical protein